MFAPGRASTGQRPGGGSRPGRGRVEAGLRSRRPGSVGSRAEARPGLTIRAGRVAEGSAQRRMRSGVRSVLSVSSARWSAWRTVASRSGWPMALTGLTRTTGRGCVAMSRSGVVAREHRRDQHLDRFLCNPAWSAVRYDTSPRPRTTRAIRASSAGVQRHHPLGAGAVDRDRRSVDVGTRCQPVDGADRVGRAGRRSSADRDGALEQRVIRPERELARFCGGSPRTPRGCSASTMPLPWRAARSPRSRRCRRAARRPSTGSPGARRSARHGDYAVERDARRALQRDRLGAEAVARRLGRGRDLRRARPARLSPTCKARTSRWMRAQRVDRRCGRHRVAAGATCIARRRASS